MSFAQFCQTASKRQSEKKSKSLRQKSSELCATIKFSYLFLLERILSVLDLFVANVQNMILFSSLCFYGLGLVDSYVIKLRFLPFLLTVRFYRISQMFWGKYEQLSPIRLPLKIIIHAFSIPLKNVLSWHRIEMEVCDIVRVWKKLIETRTKGFSFKLNYCSVTFTALLLIFKVYIRDESAESRK